MKLSFKTLNKQNFTVDAEPSETIGDIKKKVAETQGMDSPAMKLIHSGKIMADEKPVEFYNVKESDQIICMAQKPKAAPVASAAPSTPAPAPAQTPSAPAPATSANPQTAPATPSPAPAQTARSGDQSRGGMAMGAEREAAIAHVESMGFQRPEVERAMRAAFFNTDRAVEYLLSGIPPEVEAERLAAQQQPAATPPTSAPSSGQTAPATLGSSGGSGGGDDDSEHVNLFEAAAAARGGSTAPTGGAGAGAGAGGLADSLGGGGGQGGSLDFLRDNPTFQQLRQVVQQNPTMLETVLQQVAHSNPGLAQMIQANPDQFIRLLSESGPDDEEGGMPGMPPGAATVTITEEERAAIDRLCGLGFQRNSVIQAYFACDKNEELAANFLFEHGEDNDE